MSQIISDIFFKNSLSSFITCGCAIGLIVHLYCKKAHSYWRKKGIKGPAPWTLLGNVPDLMRNRKEIEVEWVATYGKVYGIYIGLNPILVVADPEILTQICVKDFETFPNHDHNPEFWDKYGQNFIFNAMDDAWKKIRYHLSPAFTSTKIRRMFTSLSETSDDLVVCAREQTSGNDESKNVNVKDIFELYTMNGVLSCCFGLKMNRGNSTTMKDLPSNNEFAHASIKMFKIAPWRVMVMFMIAHSIKRLLGFALVNVSLVEPVVRLVKQNILRRKGANEKPDDFLQLLIAAKPEENLELTKYDDVENHHAGETNESIQTSQLKMAEELQSAKLSELEVLGNAAYLIGVANETTTSLLVSSVYLLAFHKDAQERLYTELCKSATISEDDSKSISFNYESLVDCRYLDAVISESLRYFAPILHTVRVVKKDYHLEKYNIDLPKGLSINLALHAVQNDPDFWENPEIFNPERFMPGNKDKIVPGSYLPFGIGPRYCLGMRFSLAEAKLGLAKIVSNFRLEPAPNTAFPPKTELHLATQIIDKPFVRMIPRNN